MSHALLTWASHLYVIAAVLYVAYLVRAQARLALLALLLVAGGFLLQSILVVQRFVAHGYTPVTSLGDALSVLGWLLAAAFLVVERRYKAPVLGAFALPLVVGLVLPAAVLGNSSHPVPEAIKQAGMPVHVLIAFCGIAVLALSTGVAIAYLLLERQMKGKRFGVFFARLPSLEALDGISDHLMKWGFVALSVTLMTGAYYAKQAWGDYWRWDPKLTLSLVGWFVYAGLVHARLFAGWRGRRAALLTILGFTILFGSFLGLKLFPIGVHTGDFQ
ncbi:MAG: cytochrome c biogenesis protein CcsA [Deltaproteobacteria bacterium]|nr:cytochrome c biogenesis protein CcsA [Deltaproteobacteria bacterium]